jgi:ABC-type branched-subunit amino acid transport system permease subunit
MMMAYIGGTGTIIGPIIGSIFFVGLKQMLVWNVGEYHLIIFGILFILIVLFLPGGLVEAWQKIQKLVTRQIKQKNGAPQVSTSNHRS